VQFGQLTCRGQTLAETQWLPPTRIHRREKRVRPPSENASTAPTTTYSFQRQSRAPARLLTSLPPSSPVAHTFLFRAQASLGVRLNHLCTESGVSRFPLAHFLGTARAKFQCPTASRSFFPTTGPTLSAYLGLDLLTPPDPSKLSASCRVVHQADGPH
jgi:hypothetical protein